MNKIAGLTALALLTPMAALAAEGGGPDLMMGGYFVSGKPSAYGFETSVAALLQPSSDHEFMIGPKFSLFYAFAENNVTRVDLNWGIASTVWLVNAIGPGVDLDIVAPSTLSGAEWAVHYRIEPNIQARILHFGERGAWALRLGVPYDTYYKWGVQAGVTLQFNGLPQFAGGEPSEL
jgi:hypothetical protein